jgi:hypothetical protein
MKTFEAHTMFSIRPDGGHNLLHPECDYEIAPAMCTALASLSGQLDSCKGQIDLDDAVRHGIYLLSENIVSQEMLHVELQSVLEEVAQWGKAPKAAMKDLAERN